MALNQKLTPLIAGRTIQTAEWYDNMLIIGFVDGSILKIKTSTVGMVDELYARTILKVRQRGTIMNMDFTDDNSAAINLAEATSSVMLRDQAGVLEYVD